MKHFLGNSLPDNFGNYRRKIADGLNKALEMPLPDNPGEKFVYSTALTHLMSAILTKTGGVSTEKLAEKYLLDPLGIEVGLWRRDPQGICFGGSELFLTPRDMAKFGYLYLKQGIWNGQSIVPADWVKESVKTQVNTGNWGGFAEYGYWWWLHPGSYSAEGWGGQRIIVAPEQDLVVVFTSADFNEPRNIYDFFIQPAVKSGKIAANPKEAAGLAKLAEELKHQQAKPGLPLPEIVREISGKTYQLEKNDFGITALSLNFKDVREGILTLEISEGKFDLPIGLDELYRFSEGMFDVPVGIKGRWLQSDPYFEFDWINLGEPIKLQGLFIFEGDQVRFLTTLKPQNQSQTIIGKAIVKQEVNHIETRIKNNQIEMHLLFIWRNCLY
jgi:hypothetical protein